jgi:hypothetical protein
MPRRNDGVPEFQPGRILCEVTTDSRSGVTHAELGSKNGKSWLTSFLRGSKLVKRV